MFVGLLGISLNLENLWVMCIDLLGQAQILKILHSYTANFQFYRLIELWNCSVKFQKRLQSLEIIEIKKYYADIVL